MNLLFPTIDELKQAVNINRDTDLAGLRPYLASAEAQVARLLGGHAVIDELVALPVLTTAQRRALGHLRRAVGNLGVLRALPGQNVQITDAGVLRRVAAGGQGDAFQWQYDTLLASLKTEGWDAVEALLAEFDTTPGDFPEWVALRPAPLLVPSAAVFNEYYFIDNRRMTYQALLPSLRAAETAVIRPFLTARTLLMDELTVSQRRTVQQTLVYATLARALRERQIDISEAGLQVLGISEGSTATHYRKPVEDQARIEGLIRYYTVQAETVLQTVVVPVSPAALPRATRIGGDRIVGF